MSDKLWDDLCNYMDNLSPEDFDKLIEDCNSTTPIPILIPGINWEKADVRNSLNSMCDYMADVLNSSQTADDDVLEKNLETLQELFPLILRQFQLYKHFPKL